MYYQSHMLRPRRVTMLVAITLCIILAGILAVIFSNRILAAGEGERVVTVYDGDTKLTYITDANTVEEALKRGSIGVNELDAVEPALDSKLIERNYKINIYRARPVVVVDGEARTTVVTAQKSARQVAEQAGVSLYDEDEANVSRVEDVVSDGTAAQKIVIDRSVPINLNLYGKTDEVRTQAETVAELIKEKDIILGEKDGVSLPLDTPITAGMTVKVWRDGVQTITQEEDVQFEVEQIQDTAREVGYKEVKEPGVLGKKNVTYEIEMKNGEVIRRTIIQEVILNEAKKQTEIIGIKRKSGTPAENRILGKQMMLGVGFGEDQWTCLDNLWTAESGWDQYKANYQGSGAYGIPQALPGSKMGPGWESDALVQINWGLNYIKGRYGTPCGAWQAFNSRSPHWY